MKTLKGDGGKRGPFDFVGSGALSRAATRHVESLAQGAKLQNFETPVQRLTRLKGEVVEMEDVIQAFLVSRDYESLNEPERKAAINDGIRLFDADPEKLLSELRVLKKQLEAVLSDERLAAEFPSVEPMSGGKPQYDVLSHHIDELIKDMSMKQGDTVSTPNTGTTGIKPTSGVEGSFCYELYCVPSMKPLVESARLSGLEKRLADLESQLGIGKSGQTQMVFKDLLSCIKETASRLTLLDERRIDSVKDRIKPLGEEMDALLRKGDRIMNNNEVQHVQQMYELCERWRSASGALPIIIRRLKALKSLHQEASGVVTRLSVLETQQNDLAKLMESTHHNFETLRDNIASNMKWAKATINELHDKLHTSHLLGETLPKEM